MSEMEKVIEWLLKDSNITNYQISKVTGISQQVLHRYSSGTASVERISFGNAIKLYENYKGEYRMKNGDVIVNVNNRVIATFKGWTAGDLTTYEVEVEGIKQQFTGNTEGLLKHCAELVQGHNERCYKVGGSII